MHGSGRHDDRVAGGKRMLLAAEDERTLALSNENDLLTVVAMGRRRTMRIDALRPDRQVFEAVLSACESPMRETGEDVRNESRVGMNGHESLPSDLTLFEGVAFDKVEPRHITAD